MYNVTRFVAAIDQMYANAVAAGRRPTWPPPRPSGWAHLPVALIDLIWSLGRGYGKAIRITRAYAEHAATQPNIRHSSADLTRGVDATNEPNFYPHTTGEAIELLVNLGQSGRRNLCFGDESPARQCKQAPRRYDTILTAQKILDGYDVTTVGDAQKALKSDPNGLVGTLQNNIPGIGPDGAAYFPLLIGRDSLKPDRHVMAWIQANVNADLKRSEMHGLAVAVVDHLKATDHGWTLGGLDHAIWRTQRGNTLL